ncbi:hypothetical protein BCR41DRAFT_361567 [Lobosporangium transversale]|uniref:Uncharacterized protein n=1 Tax=Lobosporangium transversale TaxID=64571 RepID=A0A1Y2GAQ7_9FUNG|nr:hypothetical protein BCR41DRAFT_361567 [Lobosporangium transversale]ORZ05697.1 hypothetical protein BCR41DRAFT_361567 [Lobosporangium transversale]|eukprot:XP_021877184.1 hypothetical protein BCR41DRAFT_361567 [Lobosporangium transversale]
MLAISPSNAMGDKRMLGLCVSFMICMFFSFFLFLLQDTRGLFFIFKKRLDWLHMAAIVFAILFFFFFCNM